jgi:hypothetical protein
MATQTQLTTRRSTRFPMAAVTTGMGVTWCSLARRPQMVKRMGCALLLVFGILYGASQVAAFPPGPSAVDDLSNPPIERPEVR